MKNNILVGIFFLLLAPAAVAQDDTGIWLSAGADFKPGNWKLETEAELRTASLKERIDRWSLRAEASYGIIKNVEAGAGYYFIVFNDEKYSDFQVRNRLYFLLQAKHDIGILSFSLREKMQMTTKDESDRIRRNGETDTYAVNPEWTWRNRLKIDADIPSCKLTPSLSAETFFPLNDPERNKISKVRLDLSVSLKLSKNHSIEIFGLTDMGIKAEDTNEPNNIFIGGLAYVYSIR